MKLNEALYIAFVIGYRGDIKRNAWELEKDTEYTSIYQCCHPSNEDDNSDYLSISFKPVYIRLDDELKSKIKYNLINGIKSDYGLDLTDKDIKAEDWRVDSLMYIANDFMERIK